MSKVKKVFAPLAEFLQANTDKTVGDVLTEALAFMAAKTGGGGSHATTFHRNEAGEVTAVRCYYHGLWMDPRVVDFGAKATSATGLNSMCKDGVSKWTKQQRDLKKGKEALLDQLNKGEVEQSNLSELLTELEEASAATVPREDGYGFETLEECLADSESRDLA